MQGLNLNRVSKRGHKCQPLFQLVDLISETMGCFDVWCWYWFLWLCVGSSTMARVGGLFRLNEFLQLHPIMDSILSIDRMGDISISYDCTYYWISCILLFSSNSSEVIYCQTSAITIRYTETPLPKKLLLFHLKVVFAESIEARF